MEPFPHDVKPLSRSVETHNRNTAVTPINTLSAHARPEPETERREEKNSEKVNKSVEVLSDIEGIGDARMLTRLVETLVEKYPKVPPVEACKTYRDKAAAKAANNDPIRRHDLYLRGHFEREAERVENEPRHPQADAPVFKASEAMEKAQRELDNATNRAREALVGYRKAANKALNDEMVPASGRAYKVGELRKEAMQKLHRIESEARAQVEAAAEAASYLSRDQRSLGEQNRADSRMRLAWDRARMMLDAGVSPAEMVGRAVEKGDRETVEAMRYFAEAYMEAAIRGRGGNVKDHAQQFDALDGALKEAGKLTRHPAETVLSDLSGHADEVALIATVARQEVEGSREPITALHTDGGDFSDTADIARENAQLLSRIGGALGRSA